MAGDYRKPKMKREQGGFYWDETDRPVHNRVDEVHRSWLRRLADRLMPATPPRPPRPVIVATSRVGDSFTPMPRRPSSIIVEMVDGSAHRNGHVNGKNGAHHE